MVAVPYDQSEQAVRQDVLSFLTSPLSEDLEVTGPVKVTLYAATSARDTDFTAKLIDVHPDGKAYNLLDGIIRARYRVSFSYPLLVEPGKYTNIPLICGPQAMYLRKDTVSG